MKRVLPLLLAAALSVSMLSACSQKPSSSGASGSSAPTNSGSESQAADNSQAAGDPIVVGVLAPLTGEVSVYGTTAKNGIDLAVEEINAAGGVLGRPIKIEALDEKGDITEAVSAYNNLMDKKIVALIGDVTSKPCMAVAEYAAQDRTPMITPTGTAAGITTYGDNIFRTCFTDPFQGKTMATFAADNLKAKTAAIMYNTSDDYSQGVAAAFEETAKAKGMTIVAKEGYGADDKDYKTQLTKIQGLNPDVLFLPDYYAKIALIATQAREVGFKNPMLGADGWDGVLGALDASKVNVVDNCYFSNHYSIDDTEPVVANFVKNYTDKYGVVPTSFAALGYDSVYILKQAIETAGSTDKEAIIEALKKTDINGVTGNIRFDENGDPIKSVAITKLLDGKATLDSKITAE